jgi:hypothetical protein
LLVSTAEKLGVVDELDEELPPDADGEDEDEEDGLVADEDEGLDDDGLEDDEEDWATASVDSANITAAAVMLRPLGMEFSPVVG